MSSDEGVPAIAAVRPLAATVAPQAVEKILSLPANLPPDTPIPAEIVANADGQVTLQTPQGNITLEVDLALPVGQKITVQIADAGQTIALTVDTVNTPIAFVQPHVTPPVTTDSVIIHNDIRLPEFAPLQAKIVTLPVAFDAATLPILVTSLAQLPPQSPLPPALAEGIEKFQQLVASMGQNTTPVAAMPVPAPTATPMIQQQAAVLTILQQALPPTAATDPAFAKMPLQEMVHLQTIPPGQPVTPEILGDVQRQLATLTPPTLPTAVPATTTLVGSVSQPVTVPVVAAPPVPMLGVVIRAATPLLVSPTQPPLPQAVVLMVQPDGSPQPPQLVAVVTMPAAPLPPVDDGVFIPMPGNAVVQNAPLPGTILMAAIVPEHDTVIVFTPLPVAEVIEATVKPAALHTGLGDTWPALETVFDAVVPQMPPVMQQTIPAPTPQHLPPAMLFFMAVIKNGLTEHWLCDPELTKLPRIEKSGALAQIARDMENIAARNDDILSNDAWRPLPMPLQVGDQLLRLQWHYRHPQDDGPSEQGDTGEKRKKTRTRFLLNVPKTMLGDIQLDGLVQEQTLEVILRTENALPLHMEIAIRGRYGAALETTGMVGALHFQAGREQYVRV